MKNAEATVDRQSGRAVIVEPDGTIYYVDLAVSSELQDGSGLHVGMFLQPAMTNLEKRDAGRYPHRKLVEYLELAHAQEDCLAMLVIALDPGADPASRAEAADLAYRMLADAAVKDWLAERLRNASQWRGIADIDGIPHPKLRKFAKSFEEK